MAATFGLSVLHRSFFVSATFNLVRLRSLLEQPA
jgi:hypothetical protein